MTPKSMSLNSRSRRIIRVSASVSCVFMASILTASCSPSASDMVGQCFDLPPMKQAKVVDTVTQGGYRWLKVVQTDAEGRVSVAYVPPKVAKNSLKPCP